jgi:uncharacterized protein (DUF885 family)
MGSTRAYLLFTAIGTCFTGCAAPAVKSPIDAASGATDAALADLFRRHWNWQMRNAPLWATELGDHRFDDRLGDHSQAGIERTRQEEQAFLDETRHLQPQSPEDRVHLRLFTEMLANDLATRICQGSRWQVSTFFNGVLGWNELPEQHPVRTVADGKNLLARYREVPVLIDQDIAGLRQGLSEQRVATAESIRRVIAQVKTQLADPDEKWALTAPARASHSGWSAEEERAFSSAIRDLVARTIRPAYARYLALLENELLPHARSDDKAGLVALPDGAACYAAEIRYHTGLDKSAAELHQLGLDEMARIHGEMRALGKQLLNSDDLVTIFQRLRSDPAFHFRSSNEVMKKAEESLAAARARIPQFFGVLPRAACVVKQIPAYEQAFSTIAYYQEPHPGDGKPGEFRVNISQPETRPRHEAAVLAFHESIPGHHLQIARAQELPAMPAFRRYLGLTAFVEGWGLYSERLSDEMGLYAGDADRMGMLDYDAWRAARLVVDTGLHAMGWSRQQAIDYMKENTALAENNIVNEVDRYISSPGQALAYKVGQLEIRRLRHDAEERLGPRFDIKGFHDAVLGGGAVSLAVLADQVKAWVDTAAQKR